MIPNENVVLVINEILTIFFLVDLGKNSLCLLSLLTLRHSLLDVSHTLLAFYNVKWLAVWHSIVCMCIYYT